MGVDVSCSHSESGTRSLISRRILAKDRVSLVDIPAAAMRSFTATGWVKYRRTAELAVLTVSSETTRNSAYGAAKPPIPGQGRAAQAALSRVSPQLRPCVVDPTIWAYALAY
jgi:hypothetical protein